MRFLFVSNPKELLDIAFRKARKKSAKISKSKNRLRYEKGKHSTEVTVAGEELGKNLYKSVQSVPSFEELVEFEKQLISLVVDLKKLKQSLAQMSKISIMVQNLSKKYYSKILKSKKEDEPKKLKKEFYGRISSMIKSLDKSIQYYNSCSKKLKEIPTLKKEHVNIILAGFPNTGKTTILKRLTGSKAKIASYPFTTQSINLGYFYHKTLQFQVIDTPGLLDRPPDKMNDIEKKAILALKHLADFVVFVIDPTEQCGYSLQKQLKLLKDLKKELKSKFLIVLNKTDLSSKEQKKTVLSKIKQKAFFEGKKHKSELKKVLIETA